ncbi:MAG: alanine:cation symporter family protein [Lachnospiraceae bacterium]|nr:alanine:cation symporter family protein [Lachnospiraceae bacterium]
MGHILEFLSSANQFLWGGPLLILLLGTHLYYTIHCRFIQRRIGRAIRLSVTPDSHSSGGMSAFATLTTTLAATLGTGNIVGVSTAIALGGPGAVFWCWLTGLLGMATTYAECYLGVLYRKKQPDGSYLGGPMYALEYGLHSKPLASLYCFLTLLASYGVGCSTQSKAIADTANRLFHIPEGVAGLAAALFTGLVILGGISSISRICMRLVPAMGALYIGGCVLLLIMNAPWILPALKLIITAAFTPSAALGGIAGSTLLLAARYGIARGLFTNEAGLGTAAITAASGHTRPPHDQALISMSATFWDTVVMCAITGLVIVTGMLRNPSLSEGISAGDYTAAAFSALPVIGPVILGISIIAFAAATLIGWSYFGDRAVSYLFGGRAIKTFKFWYLFMIFLGSILPLTFVWEMTDFINALMVIPNLLALWLLRKKIPRDP